MVPVSTTTNLPAVLPVLVRLLVPMMLAGVPNGSMSLGASLRDRATLPSPLRGLGPSGGYPSRLRSLRSLRAPLAAAARCAHRRCRPGTVAARFHRIVRRTAVVSSRRRCTPRSSPCSPRSPWPAAPAAGIASARRRGTPCLAGAGFAGHRAPHRATQSCPHECGHFRPSLRQRAAHDCPRLRPRRRPLTAAAAPLRRVPRRRFPELRCCRFGRPDRPGRPWVSHPTHR